MEWIKISDDTPRAVGKDATDSIYVWVTDGTLIEIAKYILKPRSYGCAVDDDDQKATCGPQPHWHFEEIGSFKEGDLCFGRLETFEITHWMELPIPPKG